MKWLFDENVPRALVEECQSAGFDGAWIRLRAPGATDADVLAMAAAEHRITVTFDKDFGELAGKGSGGLAGVILLRIPPPRDADGARKVVAILKSRDDWVGHFSVIEPGRVRMRRLSGEN